MSADVCVHTYGEILCGAEEGTNIEYQDFPHLIRKGISINRFAPSSIAIDNVPGDHHEAWNYSMKSTIEIAQLSLHEGVKSHVASQAQACSVCCDGIKAKPHFPQSTDVAGLVEWQMGHSRATKRTQTFCASPQHSARKLRAVRGTSRSKSSKTSLPTIAPVAVDSSRNTSGLLRCKLGLSACTGKSCTDGIGW